MTLNWKLKKESLYICNTCDEGSYILWWNLIIIIVINRHFHVPFVLPTLSQILFTPPLFLGLLIGLLEIESEFGMYGI